ncbi:MAG: hypothetical protein HZA68_13125 [Rhodovulum sp.]|nr:hypothetical protein [Rhodovulum sp.]
MIWLLFLAAGGGTLLGIGLTIEAEHRMTARPAHPGWTTWLGGAAGAHASSLALAFAAGALFGAAR